MKDHVLVTGTSGAIGGAVAREIRRRFPEARLSLADVAPAPSEELASSLGNATALACDLATPGGPSALLEAARAAFGPILGLVNAAGFMEVRRFDRLPWARAEALLAVDLIAPLRLMHDAARDMLEARRGFVVNVTSMAGKVTLPGCAFYCAAKAGLSAASEIARRELGVSGVSVVTVYPGAVASALESRARDQYGRTLLSRLVPTGEPEVLARKIMDAVSADRPRVVYPSFYSAGLLPFASPFALAVGPSPVD